MQLNRLKAAQDRVQATLAKAKALYGVDINPTVRIDIKGRVAGWAGCKICRITLKRTYTLRLNRELVLGDQHHQDMLDETIPHEVAHLVCYARPELGRNHDSGWRQICIALGGNGDDRHGYAVEYAHGGFRYRASCGKEVVVSRVIHQRIQAGSTRRLRSTGGTINRYSPWNEDGQPLRVTNTRPTVAAIDWAKVPRVYQHHTILVPAPVQTALRNAVTQPSTAVSQGRTKAEQVRNMIRAARARGQGQDSVVERVMREINMKRVQASRYVSENWSKV